MIAFLSGDVKQCSPTFIWINCHGVGYELQISLKTFEVIKDKKEVFLYTYLQVREDAQILYGFFDIQEQQLFKLLIQISGISGSIARMILSSISPQEFVQIIYAQDVEQLKKIKGIGLKTAERILLELKGKMNQLSELIGARVADSTDGSTSISNSLDSKLNQAVEALQALGIKKSQAENVCAKMRGQITDNNAVESIIKLALQRL